MRRIVLDGRYLRERDSAQAYLARTLELPEYYGMNLDALADCLGEMGNDTEIVLLHSEECCGYGERVRRVLRELSQGEMAYKYSEA